MSPPPVRIPLSRPLLGEEEARAVAEVLRSGQLAEGARTRAFEEAFAKVTGAPHAVAVVNGTAALHLALLAAGVGPGDRVAVPAFTFVATANAVLMTGAEPVLVDVEDETFNLDPARLAPVLERTQAKAVLAVHLFGHPADMDSLAHVAHRHGAVVVGDAAQAVGASYRGRPVGSTARWETFSLYPTKNITSGEGGMVTTSDAASAELLRSLRNHGRGLATLGTYDHVRLGWNYRTNDLLSAIGLEQLKRLDGFNEARRANATRLSKGLAGLAGIVLPTEREGCRHAWHQYTVRVTGGRERRDALQRALRDAGIATGVYYPKPLHAYPHLARYATEDLGVSQRLGDEVLSLPVHPGLAPEDVDAVVAAVRAAL